ncbi:TPA: LemA family protein [Candidatus Micrarchaeota archaeon]|nr:LemA family protein [Candidatus Micrarchaeota archaeon]
MALEWILIGVIVLVLLFLVLLYNGLIRSRNNVDNSWSQIDVQLKKRSDLIPNLVETVKGYAKHEKEVFTQVTQARANMLKAQTVGEKAKASNMISDALKSIFAVAEAYPQLRASENFKHLQEELSDIEGKIAYARQFYNDSVLEYNNSTQVFPNNVLAGSMGFTKRDFFEVAEADKKLVKVKFD